MMYLSGCVYVLKKTISKLHFQKPIILTIKQIKLSKLCLTFVSECIIYFRFIYCVFNLFIKNSINLFSESESACLLYNIARPPRS